MHGSGNLAAATLVVAVCLSSCADRSSPPPTRPAAKDASAVGDKPDRLAALNRWENEARKATDFASLAPFEQRSGSNPHRIAALSDGRFVGLLRGSSKVVLLDAGGAELARADAPGSPVGLALGSDGALFVAGERSGSIARYEIGERSVERGEDIVVDGAFALRDIAIGRRGELVVLDDATGAVLAVVPQARPGGAAVVREIDRCHGATQVELVASHLIVNCMLDHELRIWRRSSSGKVEPSRSVIKHRGPIWTFAAADKDGALLIAAGGIEDRDLDRSDQGSFGFVDSFAFTYRVAGGKTERLAEVNVGAHGLITPKWIEIRDKSLVLASYGDDRLLELGWPDGSFAGAPEVTARDFLPGTTDFARGTKTALAANPLFDGWVALGDADYSMRAEASGDPRSVEARIGELLFFTRLMAPWGKSTGMRSRFTCEACHFEGYVDGRVHYTGRDDVSSASRSLRGLFNNRPHFSRALDRTTAGMVDNEFRVANKLNGRDYWFALSAAEFPWLENLSGVPETMSPEYLRRSLMVFLREFTNRPNPLARGRTAYKAAERRGAELFRARCESCHSARLVTDDPATAVGVADWERLIFSPEGPIVWANAKYERTGVTPYVHEQGARPPALRRLYKKWPYFTNGSAPTLEAVVRMARFSGKTFVHKGLADGERFDDAQVGDLLSFLALL